MSSHSRSFNSVRNIGVGAIKQIITLTLAFATRTIFVRLLGAEYTGVNGLFNNILTVLSLAELGVGNVLIYSLYAPLKAQDMGKVHGMLIYFKKIYTGIALAVMVIGLAFVPFLKYIVNSLLPCNEIVTYYLLYLANSVMSYFAIYKTTLIQADQKVYIQNLVSTVVLVLQYVLQIIYLLISKNFIGYLVIQVACTLGQNLILNYLANKMYPFLKESVTVDMSFDTSTIKNNIKSMFLYKMSTVLINNTDNICISIILGTIYVGYYSNYYSLITYVTTFVSLIITGITASLGNLNAEQDKDKSYRIFKNLIYMFNFITCFCVAAFTAVVQEFISIWVGKEYLLGIGTVVALMIAFYIKNVVNPVWMYRETMGVFSQIKYIMVITAFLNIIFSIVLGYKYGIVGIVIATALSRLLTIFWYEPKLLYKNKFDKPVFEYFGMQCKYLVVNLILILISVFVCNFLGGNFVFIAFKIVVCFTISMLGHTLIFRNSEEYKWLQSKAMRVVRGKI